VRRLEHLGADDADQAGVEAVELPYRFDALTDCLRADPGMIDQIVDEVNNRGDRAGNGVTLESRPRARPVPETEEPPQEQGFFQ
jgi:hypothetical protein